MPDQNPTGNTAPESAESAANQNQPDSYAAIQAKAREAQTSTASNGNGSPQAEDVLSKLLKEFDAIDLTTLPDAQVSALAEKLRSKSLSRFGELTKDKKDLATQIEALKKEREKGFAPAPKTESSPLAHITTIEDLNKEYERFDSHIKWSEAVLEDNDTAHADDVVYTSADGREFTKRQIRDSLRSTRELKETQVPAQYQQIMTREERKLLKAQTAEKAASELPWMKGEDNDTRRQYESLKQKFKFDAIEAADPELAVNLERILAHAANSMFGKPTSPAASGVKPAAALNPPSSPAFGGAASQNSNPNADRMLKEAEDRYAKSQSSEDFMEVLKVRKTVRQ